MNKPRKHAELIKAWADGAVIERLWTDHHLKDQTWLIDHDPDWSEFEEYRIRTEPKPDFHGFLLNIDGSRWMEYREQQVGKDFLPIKPQIMLTWDGETGELKRARSL